MSEFYSPDNLKEIVPFLSQEPQWLLLGGVADAREAQTARELWPSIKIVGVEPNPAACQWQRQHDWPLDAVLVCAGLSYYTGMGVIQHDPVSLRSSGCEEQRTPRQATLMVRWGDLDAMYGPFADAILWMDIETWEWEALCGATDLLTRRVPLLINIEMQSRVDAKNQKIATLLEGLGYTAVHEWNASPSCWDRVYVR